MSLLARYLSAVVQRKLSTSSTLLDVTPISDHISPSMKTFKFRPKEYGEITIDSGEGSIITTTYGKKLIDCMSQNHCISVGYGDPLVKSAVDRHRAKNLGHVTSMFLHAAQLQAAKDLVDTINHPDGDYTVHFTSSGSEAVDLALQMADFIRPGDAKMVALKNAYHGVFGMAASATDVSSMHSFPRLYTPHHRISPPDIDLPGDVKSVIVEPIRGYGGVLPLPKGYMSELFYDVKRFKGGITICDEIQSGFGRTGKSFWAFQHHLFYNKQMYPDIITFGKGAGNGHAIAGIIVKRDIAEYFSIKKTFSTFGANPEACTAMSAVIKSIYSNRYMQNALELGEMFADLPTSRVFEDVRGQGLLQGVQVNGNANLAATIQCDLLDLGILMGRGGPEGNVLRFQPPLCTTPSQVQTVIDALIHISNQK